MKLERLSRSEAGMSMLELLVILGIIGMIIAIGVPNLFKARDTAQQRACIENLSRLEGFKQQWGAEQKKSEGDIPSITDLEPYFKKPALCPAGGTYSLNALGIKCTCSVPGHTL